jgi:hypothetical protein
VPLLVGLKSSDMIAQDHPCESESKRKIKNVLSGVYVNVTVYSCSFLSVRMKQMKQSLTLDYIR